MDELPRTGVNRDRDELDLNKEQLHILQLPLDRLWRDMDCILQDQTAPSSLLFQPMSRRWENRVLPAAATRSSSLSSLETSGMMKDARPAWDMGRDRGE